VAMPPEGPPKKRSRKWVWIVIGLSFAYWRTCGKSSNNVRVTQRRVDIPGLSIDTSPPSPGAPGVPASKRSSLLTNQSIVEMVEAEVPEAVIIGHIRASRTKFDLSTQAIIALSKSDVPPAVMEAMRNPAGTGKAAAAVPIPPPVPAADTRMVPVLGGVPFEITLMEEVPNDPAEGLALHFEAAKDYRVDGAVAIAKGAAVTGEIVATEKKGVLRRGGKRMFRLITVDAVDGTKLKVKASPGRSSDKNERNIEPPGHRAKESLAPAGSTYLAYFDGDQTVAVKK
jgi:hypothetical protein